MTDAMRVKSMGLSFAEKKKKATQPVAGQHLATAAPDPRARRERVRPE
jgi:hypothetical protein